jgi:ketosteroid isomerase-like protein
MELLLRHTEAWNRHDLDALMSLFADDCVFEASGGGEVCGKRYQGKREVRGSFAEILEMMPDAEWANGRHYSLAPWVRGIRVDTHGHDV